MTHDAERVRTLSNQAVVSVVRDVLRRMAVKP